MSVVVVGRGDEFADDGATLEGDGGFVVVEQDVPDAAEIDEDAALAEGEGVGPAATAGLGEERDVVFRTELNL